MRPKRGPAQFNEFYRQCSRRPFSAPRRSSHVSTPDRIFFIIGVYPTSQSSRSGYAPINALDRKVLDELLQLLIGQAGQAVAPWNYTVSMVRLAIGAAFLLGAVQ